MTPDADGFLDDTAQKGLAIERVKGLSLGAKLVLVACALLFLSLFLTWQNLEVNFGRAGNATQLLDGWDFWGLLIAFTMIGLVSLLLLVKASDVDLPETVPWDALIVVTAVALLGLTLLKNFTDADSTWVSYLGLSLAGLVVVGACLDWASSRFGRGAALRRRRRHRFS
jgi:hypothetical protein